MNIDHAAEPDLLSQAEPVAMLALYERVSPMPVRPEYLDGSARVPLSPPDSWHSDTTATVLFQLRTAGVGRIGTGNGYRFADPTGETTALVIPDFSVLRHRPTPADEAHHERHPGWYPIDLVTLIGEVTSTDRWTDTGPKLRTYAAVGIPVHVLIDRHSKTSHCYTNPTEASYTTDTKVDLGQPLPLPAPYPALDTAPFLEG